MIGLRVPDETIDKLVKISVPGKKVDRESYHITMFYFEKNLKIGEIAETLKCLHDAVKESENFTVKGIEVTCFPKGSDGVPIIIPIVSEELQSFRKKIAKKLDKLELKYSKKFPEYKPHVTLSYSTKEIEEKKIDIKWKVSEIVIWGGDQDDDQIIVSIPFQFGKKSSRYDLVYLYSEALEKLSSL